MRVIHAAFLLVVAAAALAIWAQDAEATGDCQPTMPTANTCQGNAATSRSEGSPTPAGRCFYLKTTTTTPTCTGAGGLASNNLAWELDAGACTTVYYYDVVNSGALVPPAVPNKVTLQAYFDDTSTLIKSWQSLAAEPANGASFTFCATTDGNVGSPARAGTISLFIRAVKDNGNGLPGNINYDVRSNGATADEAEFDNGFLRAATFITSIAHTSPPAGSTFAYGPAGDETVTITATFTQQFGDANRETSFTSVLDEGTLLVGQAGATVDVDSSSLAQAFTIDTTFPAANSPYVGGWTLAGNAFHGLKHTILAASGHGANIVRVSDTFAYDSTDIAIDPGIKFDSDGAGTYATADNLLIVKLGSSTGPVVSVFNKGETYYTEGYLFNARSEKLTRTMTFAREDATPTTCASAPSTPSGAGLYSGTGLLSTGAVCATTADTTGAPRYIRASGTDQSHRSNQVFAVSSLLFVDAHPQLTDPLVEDDFPTEDAAETLAYYVRSDGMGGDASDTVHGYCHVVTVRKDTDVDTTGNAVTGTYKKPGGATHSSSSGDSDATGWTGHLDLMATTPLGTWTWTCTANFGGNSGTDVESFTFDVEGDGGETVYTGADPLTIYAGGLSNGTVPVAVHSRFLNGEARIGAAASIFVSVFDWPTMNPVVTGAAVVEVDSTNAPGAYAYNFTPPYSGAFLVTANTTDVDSNPIGAHNVIDVSSSDIAASLQEHRDGSIEVLMTSNFAGLGFDGFIFLLFWIAVLLFASYMGWLVLAGFSIPGILFTAIPSLGALAPDLDFPTLLAFALLGFVLEVAANKWSWGGYESGKRKLRLGA